MGLFQKVESLLKTQEKKSLDNDVHKYFGALQRFITGLMRQKQNGKSNFINSIKVLAYNLSDCCQKT